MFNGKRVGVIIPAAGQGRRMGGSVPKQFLELAGKPIVEHTILRFESAEEVDAIVLAVSADAIGSFETYKKHRPQSKLRAIVAGGAERQDSVWNGLMALENEGADLVLVHDAVRPFVGSELISDVIAAADTYGAAIPAIPLKDTVKSVDADNFVSATLDRSLLRRVQTPQGFHISILVDAFRRAMAKGEYGTDESMLLEKLGVKVRFVEGNEQNMKLTTPGDIAIAEMFLRTPESGRFRSPSP